MTAHAEEAARSLSDLDADVIAVALETILAAILETLPDPAPAPRLLCCEACGCAYLTSEPGCPACSATPWERCMGCGTVGRSDAPCRGCSRGVARPIRPPRPAPRRRSMIRRVVVPPGA